MLCRRRGEVQGQDQGEDQGEGAVIMAFGVRGDMGVGVRWGLGFGQRLGGGRALWSLCVAKMPGHLQ